jgi:hypothetical protein
MQQILADGKEAIPVLISQLTETARTEYQIADYWGDTRSGDVAYVILIDLFTDIIFYVHIPLAPTERDDEARRYLAKLEKSMTPQQITQEARQRALEQTRELVYQHRVGHFQVECRILDSDRVIGVGVVELEVLFKGRFSDVGLPASPPV